MILRLLDGLSCHPSELHTTTITIIIPPRFQAHGLQGFLKTVFDSQLAAELVGAPQDIRYRGRMIGLVELSYTTTPTTTTISNCQPLVPWGETLMGIGSLMACQVFAGEGG